MNVLDLDFKKLASALIEESESKKWDETVKISEILENIVQDIRTWEKLSNDGKVDEEKAGEQAYALYLFAERYLFTPTTSRTTEMA